MIHTVPIGSLERLLETLDLRRPLAAAHSRRVAAYARQLAVTVGLAADERTTLVDAALVHEAGALVGAVGQSATDLPGFETWCGLSEDVADVLWYVSRRFEHYRHAPLGARLLAVAHAFDELTATREYQVPMRPDSARMAIARDAGRRFCPIAVNALMAGRLESFDGSPVSGARMAMPDAPVRLAPTEELVPYVRDQRLVTSA